MKRRRWYIAGLASLVACALVLPGGCRKETAPAQNEPTEHAPLEPAPAESKASESASPESALRDPAEPTEKPRWDDTPFDLETSLEAEPDVTVPGGLDGL
jgi:hypothetical protein